MSAYTKTKILSKSLILLSLLAIVISGGAFLVDKSKIGADTSQLPDYRFESPDSSHRKIIIGNVSSSEILDFDYGSSGQNINNGIKQLFVDDCGNIQKNGSVCYSLDLTNNWPNPSVFPPFKPAFAFLTEALAKVTLANDQGAKDIITSARALYAWQSLQQWQGTTIAELTSGSSNVIIRSNEFFNAIDLSDQDLGDYITITNSSVSGFDKTAELQFHEEYPLAKKGSVWLDGIDFLLTSIVDVWQTEYGVDMSNYRDFLILHRTIYNAYAEANESRTDTPGSNNILSLQGPARILIGNDGSTMSGDRFVLKIDTTKFPKPADGNYKTQIYIKPDSLKSNNIPFIMFPTSGPGLTESEFAFAWSDIANSQYVSMDPSGNRIAWSPTPEMIANGIAPLYQTTYPQKYFMHVITYQADGSTPKDELTFNFETVNEDYITGATVEDLVAIGNFSLNITAESVNDKTIPVQATIELTDKSIPKIMNKIVIWACKGDGLTVKNSDSSTCGEPKAAFATSDVTSGRTDTWKDFSYSGDSASFSYDWDTSGTTPGTYALMIKGYKTDGTPVDNRLKSAVTIKITDSKAPTAGNINSGMSNLLTLGSRASENATGSNIRTIQGLAERIANLVLMFIGILAFFALVYGGYTYMSAGGDSAKADKAKKVIMYAILGLALAALAYAITRIFVSDILSIFPGVTKHIFP